MEQHFFISKSPVSSLNALCRTVITIYTTRLQCEINLNLIYTNGKEFQKTLGVVKVQYLAETALPVLLEDKNVYERNG